MMLHTRQNRIYSANKLREVLKLWYSNSSSAKLSKTAGNWCQFYILLLNQEKGFMPLIKGDFPGKIYPTTVNHTNTHKEYLPCELLQRMVERDLCHSLTSFLE